MYKIWFDNGWNNLSVFVVKETNKRDKTGRKLIGTKTARDDGAIKNATYSDYGDLWWAIGVMMVTSRVSQQQRDESAQDEQDEFENGAAWLA